MQTFFYIPREFNNYVLCTQPWPVPVDILSNNMTKMTMYAQANQGPTANKVIII